MKTKRSTSSLAPPPPNENPWSAPEVEPYCPAYCILPCILPCITTLELPGPFSGPWIPAASEFPARNIIDAISVHIYFSFTPSLPFAMIWKQKGAHNLRHPPPPPQWKSMIRPWSRAILPCILPCITTLELPGPFSGPWIPAASEFPARNIIDAISVHIYFSFTPSLPFAMIWKQKGAHNLWHAPPPNENPWSAPEVEPYCPALSGWFGEVRWITIFFRYYNGFHLNCSNAHARFTANELCIPIVG